MWAESVRAPAALSGSVHRRLPYVSHVIAGYPSLFQSSQLFAEHASQRRFKRLARALDMLAKCRVDKGLIVAAAGLFDGLLEPLKHILIQPDRNPALAFRNRYDSAAFAFREIVLFAH
jgi:hypothetical protein